ncbi:MAG: ribonuclease Z [Bacteroidales bacterium]|jgi:ribonuclease Z|nr:ribonuclease Z [Bacteroidales bacterium]MCK9499116.1 ribonuclease Z [Bacteroidales bacterium]MDY0314623.1 ribonuclease Z [Bacteroidales bacterium]NLB85882.1 ribonuclease Z [Bacteroidales bacterium]
MQFQIKILGSSSALPSSTRMPSAQAVIYNKTPYLIDCAEATQMQMRKYSIPFGKLKHIFISHLHGDHFYGIFGLLSSFNLLGREQDLHIYAPPKLKEIIKTLHKLNGDELKYKLIFHDLTSNGKNLIFQNKYLEIYSFPLKHSKAVWGFLFQEKEKLRNIKKEVIEKYNLSISEIVKVKNGDDLIDENGKLIKNQELTYDSSKPRTYAYCTDTIPIKDLDKYIYNVDLLYHEATFGSELADIALQTFHSTPSQAAEIAKLVNAKKLLIGHFSTRYKNINPLLKEAQQVFKNTIAAEDGLLLNL